VEDTDSAEIKRVPSGVGGLDPTEVEAVREDDDRVALREPQAGEDVDVEVALCVGGCGAGDRQRATTHAGAEGRQLPARLEAVPGAVRVLVPRQAPISAP